VSIHIVGAWLFGVLLMTASANSFAASAGKNAGNTAVSNRWDSTWFDYERPDRLIVEESTPTAAQVDYTRRPPQRDVSADEKLTASAKPARPRAVGPLDVVHLRFRDAGGDVVPALLCTPRGKQGPFPVVIAVHGLTSNKAQVCAQIAPALAERGFAVLSADMPRHGERPGDPRSVLDRSNPFEAFALFHQAVVDVRQLIDLAESRPELDTRDGVVLAGYSMGSWVNSVAGPADPRVRAMVLMVGGATEMPPAARLVPQIAATDPRLAIAHFAGKPLLMLGGKRDYVVTPDMVKRLYAAAGEPKELVWYDSGHLLTEEAYEKAAEWVANLRPRVAGAGRSVAGVGSVLGGYGSVKDRENTP
jgi:dienelactone hydrolase